MKLKVLLTAVAIAAILPVAALADGATSSDKANGSRSCQALKTSLGDATFKSTYGTNADKSNAFGKCVVKWTEAERQNRLAAQTACKAEQADAGFAAAHGGKTFAQFYGIGRNGAGAMAKCIASKRVSASTEERQDVVKAAKSCKAERTGMGAAAFKAKYGTGESKANAFGKCVAKLAQAQQGS